MIFAVKPHSFFETLEENEMWIISLEEQKTKTLFTYLFRDVGFIEDRETIQTSTNTSLNFKECNRKTMQYL